MTDLKPGQILLFRAKGLNFWERVITSQERDTDVCHAAIVGPQNTIYTTGAHGLFFYGLVQADAYLKGKSYYVCESAEPLTPIQLATILTRCKSFTGQRYGLEKVLLLSALGSLGGVVTKIHPTPQPPDKVRSPFCSEAVAAAYWEAGLKLGADWGKLEPSAVSPANILVEAKEGRLIKVVALC